MPLQVGVPDASRKSAAMLNNRSLDLLGKIACNDTSGWWAETELGEFRQDSLVEILQLSECGAYSKQYSLAFIIGERMASAVTGATRA
jgi:hypothetical protein